MKGKGRAAAIITFLIGAFTALAQNPAVTTSVDAAANQHPINPNIYGVAYASTDALNALNAPLNRNGGNNEPP